jgi:hypothetical protein
MSRDFTNFQTIIKSLTTGVETIPTNAIGFSIAVESGSALIDGVTVNAGTVINGGGYHGGARLNTAVTVGCTGGRVLITYDL